MTYRNHFLSNLSPGEAAVFKPYLVEVTLRPGQHLHRSGEPIEQVYFPHSGIVRLAAAISPRALIQAAIIGCEGVVGGVAALGQEEAFSDATVQVGGIASRMAVDKFRSTLRQSDEHVRDAVMQVELFCMAQAQQTAACNALHSAEARICRTLLEMHDRMDGKHIPLTQAALAASLGIQRTTVTLISSKLQKLGMLLCQRGHLHLVDRSAIERRSCECYGQVHGRFEQLLSPPKRTASLARESAGLAGSGGAPSSSQDKPRPHPSIARPSIAATASAFNRSRVTG